MNNASFYIPHFIHNVNNREEVSHYVQKWSAIFGSDYHLLFQLQANLLLLPFFTASIFHSCKETILQVMPLTMKRCWWQALQLLTQESWNKDIHYIKAAAKDDPFTAVFFCCVFLCRFAGAENGLRLSPLCTSVLTEMSEPGDTPGSWLLQSAVIPGFPAGDIFYFFSEKYTRPRIISRVRNCVNPSSRNKLVTAWLVNSALRGWLAIMSAIVAGPWLSRYSMMGRRSLS